MGEVRVKGGKINSAMDQFTPNCYVEVGTSGILAKIEALRMYRGVMRPYPHPRSEEYITGLAAFRGKRTGYGGLFTSDNPVYVYGDLMSLVCDANYEPLRSLTATNAFKESFKGRTNVDIDPEKELVLSAETVGTSGYLSMFEGCSSLTSIRCLATNYSGDSYTKQWLQNAKNTAECTFYKKAGAVWNTGTNGIPDKWNVVEVD